ncbi:MAG: hypothetical protein IJ194_00340 [Bacilli bacterium]|nr:hypothetical protein [Bacilli bacterium]
MVKAKIILPAMLLLSALSGLSFQQKEVKTYLEFGDAQEEIFGEAQGIEIAHKGLKGKVNGALPTPKVGFQSQTHVNNEKTYVDIRFVAAINVTDLSNVTATWNRTNLDSNLVEGKQYIKESTQAYTGLIIDGMSYAPSVYGDYNYFIAYVIRNIPQETASENYMDVTLTLQEGEDGFKSNIYSVKCDGTSGFSYQKGDVTFFTNYHYPSANDDGSFTNERTRVKSGSKVLASSPKMGRYGGEELIDVKDAGPSGKNNGVYLFDNWFTAENENKYANVVDNDAVVVENADYYAKYTCNNTLFYYDGSHLVYTMRDAEDVVIGANEAKYGRRILGYSSYNGQDANAAFVGKCTTINLTSSSGVYKLIRNDNSGWTIQRKVGIKPKPSNWWEYGARTYIYCSGSASLNNSYSLFYLSAWGDSIYVDASYTSFLFQRFDPNGDVPTGKDKKTAWTDSSHSITLNGFNNYSSANIFAMINDNNSNMAWVDVNTNDMPYL